MWVRAKNRRLVAPFWLVIGGVASVPEVLTVVLSVSLLTLHACTLAEEGLVVPRMLES